MEATYDGKYLSDVFLIEFPSHKQLFSKKDRKEELTFENYALFIHEYWHYLINISTLARVRDFHMWHTIISIFSKTLSENADGTSVGLNYDDKDRDILKELNELRGAYNGGYYENIKSRSIYDFTVIGEFCVDEYNLTMHGKKTPIKKVIIPIEADTEDGKMKGYFILGNHAIEESLVNSIEKIIFDDGKRPSTDPYLVLNRISEFYNNGESINKEEIAVLGTLSLLTTDPALSVVNLIKDFCGFKNRVGTAKALEEVTNTINLVFDEIIPVIKLTFDDLKKIYIDREPVCFAIDYISEKILKCFEIRKKDLLFELTPILKIDKKLLDELIFEKIKPCDVLQVCSGDENKIMRDVLKSFEVERRKCGDIDLDISFLMQIMHCQVDYVKAHGLIHIFPSDNVNVKSKCPYYTTCDLSFRKTNPIKCMTAPWTQFNKNSENCVYGHAVSNLIGHTKLKRNK